MGFSSWGALKSAFAMLVLVCLDIQTPLFRKKILSFRMLKLLVLLKSFSVYPPNSSKKDSQKSVSLKLYSSHALTALEIAAVTSRRSMILGVDVMIYKCGWINESVSSFWSSRRPNWPTVRAKDESGRCSVNWLTGDGEQTSMIVQEDNQAVLSRLAW